MANKQVDKKGHPQKPSETRGGQARGTGFSALAS